MTNDIKFTRNKDKIEFENERRAIKKRALYQHFKGGIYIVEDIAIHSETKEEMVVYRNLKTGKLWTRPLSMFMDIKETEKGYIFRFTRINHVIRGY